MRPNPDTVAAGWPENKKLAISVSVMLEGWTDDSAPGLGPMGNPLKAGVLDTQARSWAEYGPRVGAWRLLDVLNAEQVKAVFYSSGILADRYPDLMKAIVGEGHELAAHAWAQNIVPAYQAYDEELADLRRSMMALKANSGVAPRGWISPRATPSMNTPTLLAGEGIRWYADAFDRDLPYVVEAERGKIVAIPFTVEVNDVPLYVRYGNEPTVFTHTLKTILDGWTSIGAPFGCLDITAHAHVFGRPVGAMMLRESIKLAKECAFGWMATHAVLADLWHPTKPERAAA